MIPNEVPQVHCSAEKTDRYISFEGIECDDYARRIYQTIRDCIGEVDRPSPWQSYFERKMAEIERMGQDELFFVGSQVNYIRELFVFYGCQDALVLLDKVEDECC
jgi:N(2)-fixation sustaining protein CowN